jgi:hypothetical protein
MIGGETKSVASSKRDTTGKFEGGAKFGDYIFIKKGLTNGNQRWQCSSCKAKTTEPNKHKCTK